MRIPSTLWFGLVAEALLAVPALAAPLSPESQKVYDTRVKPFLKAHCTKCHDGKVTRAGFRIDTLDTDFLAGKTADQWREIYDKIGLDEMPPKKQPRPNPKAAAEVTDWIIQELRNAEKLAKNSSGRIPTRRLNRSEYANTLRDLFYLDDKFARNLEEELPLDGKVDGFDRGAAGLYIDDAQLNKYLEIADLVLSREVFSPKPKTFSKQYLLRNLKTPSDFELVPVSRLSRDRVKVPLGATSAEFKDGGLEFKSARGLGSERLAIPGVLSGGGNWYGIADPLRSGTFQEGWYRLKFRAGAFKGTGKTAIDEVRLSFKYCPNTPFEAQETLVIDAPLDKPRDFEVKVFLRPGPPELSRYYTLSWNGLTNVLLTNPEFDRLREEWGKLYNQLAGLRRKGRPQAELDAVQKKIDENNNAYSKTVQGLKAVYHYNPDLDLRAIPRLRIESFTIEGPVGTWPPKGRTELFFSGEQRPIDKDYIRKIFARFLPRAYRRPVQAEEIDAVVAWVVKAQKVQQLSGTEAVKLGVKAVLCSPEFLLLQEPNTTNQPRQLNDHELAVRLSYFLWSTMPDADLSKLAADNKLHDPPTLTAQVRRMLADPKAASLVHDFTGQWLKVREFPSVTITSRQFPLYDDELRDSSRREPYEFFKEVLDKDLSILNFVDSDFLVIDERLARHYGIQGVAGKAFRKVAIRPDHHRGGVLGMAGVLAYLTDGQRSLPVRRGAYVLDTLWNSPPKPPPPNAGDLPPVSRNIPTVRLRLEQHRNNPSCASCHARIDPFGLALENYDTIGFWRESTNGAKSPPVDVSGILPTGRKFKDLREYKQALLAEKEKFVRGFVEKMLGYALSRSVGATDRGTVDEIINKLESGQARDRDKYRLQALVQAIVASQVFRMK
jgi:hypothetical protein